ncbi:hypothetical protein [Pseudoalteromonas sp. MMG012]|uniref:hypothetical protein n=1 Tax=Pseudoalteromonas sp. MMG012 TaxID=2822686 RepID=UPI001B39DBA5|nr:hypothetical protein [Pseudoalteromonas sp. MMG012]MBQ4852675.1 hypothetical protein [Pseudoalteromonas sp. MMG012]
MHIHGFVEYTWQDDILCLNVSGPFNMKGVTEAFEQLKTTVNSAQHEQWYRIEEFDPETLGCLEVMKVIRDSYLWSLEHGCLFIAVVCSHSVQMNLLESFIERTNLPIKGFFCAKTARLAIEALRNKP